LVNQEKVTDDLDTKTATPPPAYAVPTKSGYGNIVVNRDDLIAERAHLLARVDLIETIIVKVPSTAELRAMDDSARRKRERQCAS